MNKSTLFIVLGLLNILPLLGQVGIGTTTPHPKAVLELKSSTQGVMFPRMTTVERDAIQNPAEGLTIFNISDNFIQTFTGVTWESYKPKVPVVTTINCASPTFNPERFNSEVVYTGTVTIPYTGGNGAYYSAGSPINGVGVTGNLTATLQAGTLAYGTGSLTYNISGTPNSEGIVTFPLSFGGVSCSISAVVYAKPLPAGVTLQSTQDYFIVSVHDQDYHPYAPPTLPASLATAQVADGTSDATQDYQGVLTTTGVQVRIFCTVTANVNLPAYSKTINIPASYTEDGISRDVVFSYTAQSLAPNNSRFFANIKAVGGNLNLKKLDLQSGIGNDYLGVLVTRFTYSANSSGLPASADLRLLAAIPDRNIADPEHQMFYLPVLAADNKVWLNNNLGANYSYTARVSYNPTKQASAHNDPHAYGSMFQWGRLSDGHELVNLAALPATFNYGTYQVTSTTDVPENSLWISKSTNEIYSTWRLPHNTSLWQGASGINNPCPVGFRVPTMEELQDLMTASGITNSATAFSSVLKFSVAGDRHTSGSLNGTGWYARLASSNAYPFGASGLVHRNLAITSDSYYEDAVGASVGTSVRCIKD